MKKHLSTFMLMARFALWPTLAAALLGAAVSAALLFSGGVHGSWDSSNFFDKADYAVTGAVVLLFVLLLRPMRERGGIQPGYTLRRLGVSELTAYIWQSLAAAMGFFICLMAQAAVIFAFALYTQAQGQGPAGDMSALVMLYLSPVAHALMPLSDWPVYIRMLLVCCALGAAASYFPFMNRHSKTAFSPFVILAAAIFGGALRADIGDYTMEGVIGGISFVVIGIYLYAVHYRAADIDDEDDPLGLTGGADSAAQS